MTAKLRDARPEVFRAATDLAEAHAAAGASSAVANCNPAMKSGHVTSSNEQHRDADRGRCRRSSAECLRATWTKAKLSFRPKDGMPTSAQGRQTSEIHVHRSGRASTRICASVDVLRKRRIFVEWQGQPIRRPENSSCNRPAAAHALSFGAADLVLANQPAFRFPVVQRVEHRPVRIPSRAPAQTIAPTCCLEAAFLCEH